MYLLHAIHAHSSGDLNEVAIDTQKYIPTHSFESF